MALKDKLKAKILKLETKIDQLRLLNGTEIEEDLPSRKRFSLCNDDFQRLVINREYSTGIRYPVYARTDMFDYKANN